MEQDEKERDVKSMKHHSQILIITVVAACAVALALAVSLIFLSYVEETPPPTDIQETGTRLHTLHVQETEVPAPSLSGGLRFSSNGDGTCVLSGVGDCADACVVIPEYSPGGERVTSVSTMAFYGCATVTAIQIPASVKSIGNLAFSACSNLAYVSVSQSSPYYKDVDGVLYTADLSTLVLYPPMRAGAQVSIPAATVEICDMAFFGCAYLKRISYVGSAEEWELIRIGSKNYSLTAASVSFEGEISVK